MSEIGRIIRDGWWLVTVEVLEHGDAAGQLELAVPSGDDVTVSVELTLAELDQLAALLREARAAMIKLHERIVGSNCFDGTIRGSLRTAAMAADLAGDSGGASLYRRAETRIAELEEISGWQPKSKQE